MCVCVVLCCAVLCGVVWSGVVWCGVVWCGVVWCGVCVSRRFDSVEPILEPHGPYDMSRRGSRDCQKLIACTVAHPMPEL